MVGHLLCGMLLGWLAALASLLAGFSVENALKFYVVGTALWLFLVLVTAFVQDAVRASGSVRFRLSCQARWSRQA